MSKYSNLGLHKRTNNTKPLLQKRVLYEQCVINNIGKKIKTYEFKVDGRICVPAEGISYEESQTCIDNDQTLTR